MAKSILFTAEELAALQSFYSNELKEAKEKVKSIEAVLNKIGSVPKKRGRKPAPEKKDIETELNTSLNQINSAAPKKQGRPSSKKVSSEAPKRRGRPRKGLPTEVESKDLLAPKRRGRPRKTIVASNIAPKKRGRPKKEVISIETGSSPKRRGRPKKDNLIVSKTIAPKRRGRPKKDALEVSESTTPKRRGRPKKVSSAAEIKVLAAKPARKRVRVDKKAAPASLAKERGGNVKTEVVELTLTEKPAKKRARKAKLKVGTATLARKKAERTVKGSPKATKVVIPKKSVAKVIEPVDNKIGLEAKIAALENQVEKAKEVVNKTKKASAAKSKSSGSIKLTYNNFLLELLTKEERFLSTPEINESAFDTYRTKEADKRKIKSTLQTTLHRLESENLIQLRKKIGERLSYWAVPSVSDFGFIKDDSKSKK